MSDLDDLDDLLSEGSDDSFFDDPNTKINKNVSKKSDIETTSVSQVFGLDKKKETKSNSNSDWLTDSKITRDQSDSKNKSLKKVSFEDDILDTLGLENRSSEREKLVENKEPSVAQKDSFTKKALLEDIFGLKVDKPKSISDHEKIDSNDEKKIFAVNKPEQKQPDNFDLSFAREGRRSRTIPSVIKDPLGFLSSTTSQENAAIKDEKRKMEFSTENVKNQVGSNKKEELFVPNKSSSHNISWLLKDSNVAPQNENQRQIDQTSATSEEDLKKYGVEEIRESETSIGKSSGVTTTTSMNLTNQSSENLLKELMLQRITSTQGNVYQNTSLALQQQESLLVMALHMKKYEDCLKDIQKKQEEMFEKQDEYLKRVAEEQSIKRSNLETTLQIQQDKINRFIENLLSSRHLTKTNNNEDDKREEEKEDSKLVTLIKEKQHEEMFIIEESYKKQISLLEEMLKSVEDRLRAELNKKDQYHTEMVENVTQNYKKEIEKYENKIKTLEENYSTEVNLLKERHARVVEDVKNEFREMINNIKETKGQENRVFEDSKSYITKIGESIEILSNSSANIQEMKSKMQEEFNILVKAREETIKAKEKEIEMMKISLEKAREISETERSQLMALISSLELKLAEQSQNSREDRWAFQQATSSLVAKMAALDREAEFQRTSIEREREQLKTLKENLLAEQEKLILQLTEEKLALSAEKSRLDVSSKLAQNFDAQKAQVEVEAAVKAAREAMEKTDQERENLLKAQHELESCKRELRDRENNVSMKEKSVEMWQKQIEERAVEAERALAQAKLIESTYTTRMKEMHKQLTSLSRREKKLAEEKLSFSKDRLALQLDLQQLRRCSLCTSSVQFKYYEDQNLLENLEMLDPDMLKLRNEANEDNLISPTIEGHTED